MTLPVGVSPPKSIVLMYGFVWFRQTSTDRK